MPFYTFPYPSICIKKGLDLKSVWGHQFTRNRYYISIACVIVVYLYPPFYPPFCFNSEINLLRAHAPARRCHVSVRASCINYLE